MCRCSAMTVIELSIWYLCNRPSSLVYRGVGTPRVSVVRRRIARGRAKPVKGSERLRIY